MHCSSRLWPRHDARPLAAAPRRRWLQALSHTRQPKTTTLLLCPAACALHCPPPRFTHPETSSRAKAIASAVRTATVQQLRDGQVAWVEDVRKPLSLTEPILQRVHTERHIATLTHAFAALRLFPEELGSPSASVPTFGTGSAAEVDRRETFYFDSDTPAAHGTEEAVLAAAAAAIAAVDSVVLGEAVNAFCITRPPGHHAEADRAMGFCFLNNAALAAVHALESRETATCPHECNAQLKHLTTECRASPLPPAFAGPQMRLGFLGLLS